jgi:hypothetical protein
MLCILGGPGWNAVLKVDSCTVLCGFTQLVYVNFRLKIIFNFYPINRMIRLIQLQVTAFILVYSLRRVSAWLLGFKLLFNNFITTWWLPEDKPKHVVMNKAERRLMNQHQLDILSLVYFVKSCCLYMFRASLAHPQESLYKCCLVQLRA